MRHARKQSHLKYAAGGALFTAAALAVALLATTGPSSGAVPTVTTKTGVVTHGGLNNTTDTVGWLLTCQPSHTLPDDPIVHPGNPGASHLHDFWGNASATGNSTLATQEDPANNTVADTYNGAATKPGTSCDLGQYAPGTAGDTASYWAPSLYANGVRVTPGTKAQLYYRRKPLSGTGFVSIPQDARIIVGLHSATSIDTNPALRDGKMYWECTGNSGKHYQLPPTSCTSILLNVVFPSCYDGGPMDHTGPQGTDNERFTYAVNGACPAGYPQKMPQLSEKLKYNVPKTNMLLQLSADQSMPDSLMPTFTAHTDFWNSWSETALQYLVTRCVNAGISCGTNPITPLGPVPPTSSAPASTTPPATSASTTPTPTTAAPTSSEPAASTPPATTTPPVSTSSPTPTTSAPSATPTVTLTAPVVVVVLPSKSG